MIATIILLFLIVSTLALLWLAYCDLSERIDEMETDNDTR